MLREIPKFFEYPTYPSLRADGLPGCGAELVIGLTTAAAAAVWPASGRAIYLPLRVSDFVIVDRGFLVNGGTANGTIDIGIFNAARVRMGSTGTVVQTGTNVRQVTSFTSDIQLARGFYYIGISLSGVTGTAFRYTPDANVCNAMGVRQEAAAHPLPATATFAAAATNYFPSVGVLVKGY